MSVYFNPSLSEAHETRIKVDPIRVDWEFIYTKKKYKIPFLYRFSKGFIFDVISILNYNQVQQYSEDYKHGQHSVEDEIIYMEAKNPVLEINFEDILLNGQSAKDDWESSSSVYMPWSSDNEAELSYLKKTYNFLPIVNSCFYCMRTCVKFPNKIQEPLHTFSVVLSKTEQLLPIRKHFKLPVGELARGQKIEFKHPATQQKHKLHVALLETVNRNEIFPLSSHPYYVKLVYELEPNLSNAERLLLKQLNREKQQLNEETSMGGIIGGTSGVTTIYTKRNSVLGKHGFPLRTEFLESCWQEPKEIQLSIVGIYAPQHQMQKYCFSFPPLREI